MFKSFSCREFLKHIPCWLHFYLGSFSYSSHASFLFLFLSRKFLFHIPCWFLSFLLFLLFYQGSFSYTSRASMNSYAGSFLFHIPCCLICIRVVSLTHPVLDSFFIWRLSLTHPGLAWNFMQGVSLTHPVLLDVLCGEFLLHIPCWLRFYLVSFSYTSRAGFNFFFLGSFSYTSRACFISMLRVSLTHPGLAWILMRGVSLPHTVLLDFYAGSFSYTSRAWFVFYLGSFSYTSRVGLFFIKGSFSYTSPG